MYVYETGAYTNIRGLRIQAPVVTDPLRRYYQPASKAIKL